MGKPKTMSVALDEQSLEGLVLKKRFGRKDAV
jgi:hypothetical protein